MIHVIKKNTDFQRIFDQGHSIFGRYLVVYFLKNENVDFRWGFCVGKKTGTAVTRNRIKRLLREAVRLIHFEAIRGWDILLIARQPVLKADLKGIVQELNYLCSKARIYNSPQEKEDSC